MKNAYNDNLISNRLRTRFIQPEDAIHWCAFVSDQSATEFFPDFYAPDNPLPSAERFLAKQFVRYMEETFGLQALIEKQTGEFIGLCGLLLQLVDGKQELEVGYQILPSHWGQGYATEAARLFMDYAADNKLTDSIISVIDVGNIASQKVAVKNGLTREKRIEYQGLDVWVYRKVLFNHGAH